MRTVCRVAAGAAASTLILAGCSSPSSYHQTVTGILVRVGGPAPGSPVPLPGQVGARNTAGEQFTAATSTNGRFQLSLPPGIYRLTGHSPQVGGTAHPTLCSGVRTLNVTRNKPAPYVEVVCSIS